MKTTKISHGEKNVGRFMRVRWDDVGCEDCLCVDYDPTPRKVYSVWCPATDTVHDVDSSQVKAIGPRIKVPEF